MSNNLDEVSDGLEELIEEYLSRITDKLRQAHSIKDVSDEVGTLNDLLNSCKRRTQMFDSLVDARTPEARKAQLRDKLEAQNVRVIANREACKRTVERSHEILRRSARLLSSVASTAKPIAARVTSWKSADIAMEYEERPIPSVPGVVEKVACWSINPRLSVPDVTEAASREAHFSI